MSDSSLKRQTTTTTHNTTPASKRSHVSDVVTATVMWIAVIMSLCPNASGQSDLLCGNEYRIETKDGATFQGTLLSNNGNLLALGPGASGLHTVALADVANVFRVERRAGQGAQTGAILGTVLGCAVALAWYRHRDEEICTLDGRRCVDADRQRAEFVAIAMAGTCAGALVGYIIGHSTQRLDAVKLEALPMCATSSGDLPPIRISFVVYF